MLFHVNPADPTPIYAQLERAIRLGIATGRLQPDAQLPTVRQLAVELSVNANTVAKVYRDLERAGVLETRRGVGTFIRKPQPDVMPAGERQRLLRDLADRFLAEAATQGFPAQELLAHLQGRLTKEKDAHATLQS
jgi:GntR family transcriptional regulator